MPIGIMGSKSLALTDRGSRCRARRKEKLWIHEFVLFLSTRLNTCNHGTVKSPLPIITFDIVAYASPRFMESARVLFTHKLLTYQEKRTWERSEPVSFLIQKRVRRHRKKHLGGGEEVSSIWKGRGCFLAGDDQYRGEYHGHWSRVRTKRHYI